MQSSEESIRQGSRGVLAAPSWTQFFGLVCAVAYVVFRISVAFPGIDLRRSKFSNPRRFSLQKMFHVRFLAILIAIVFFLSILLVCNFFARENRVVTPFSVEQEGADNSAADTRKPFSRGIPSGSVSYRVSCGKRPRSRFRYRNG
jgi:hypothetical protein